MASVTNCSIREDCQLLSVSMLEMDNCAIF
jgi:hypothetical protein